MLYRIILFCVAFQGYCVVPHYIVLCGISRVLCCTALYCLVWHFKGIVLYRIILCVFCGIVGYCVVPYYIVLCGIEGYCVVPHYIVLCGIEGYCIGSHYIVLCGIEGYCVVPHYIGILCGIEG